MSITPRIPISKAMETPADSDERDSDQAEVEGHGWRFGKAAEQPNDAPEVEGHGIRGNQALPQDQDANDPERADVEVHDWARFGMAEQPSDDPEAEVEGHGRKPPRAMGDAVDAGVPEVVGHGRYSGPADVDGPAQGRFMGRRGEQLAGDPEANDIEGLTRKG